MEEQLNGVRRAPDYFPRFGYPLAIAALVLSGTGVWLVIERPAHGAIRIGAIICMASAILYLIILVVCFRNISRHARR